MIDALKSKLEGLTAASLTDAMGRLCPHRAHILDLVSPTPGRVLFGRAATIRYLPYREDLSSNQTSSFSRFFYEAITEEFDETVLVLNNPCGAEISIGGGVKFSRLHNHKVAGLITDARIRDFAELASYDPVFYCSGEAVEAGVRALMPIAVNVPVNLRGTAVVPGDYIFADCAAAVVIPAHHIDRALELAHEITEQDKSFLRTIKTENPDEIRRHGSSET
ncbi:RraA family protein [Sphingobium chungangianum]